MMLFKMNTIRTLLSAEKLTVVLSQKAGLQNFPIPQKYDHVEFPERPRLKIMEKVPQYPSHMRPFKMQKKLRLMRGPEMLHTDLLHKQFGIVATCGGRLRFQHFEMIRMFFVRHMDFDKKVFAVWRVDAPWQPVTKKGQGTRMGGGKGAIDHYVTPVKSGRVIVEVGGRVEYEEVRRVLENVAARLPFRAKAVSHEMLQEDREKERKLEEDNVHPWTFKYMIQNNLCGCHNWITPTDKIHYGKFK